ncbi:MAG: manganese efflux pump [Clostridia bacterium]|nr:manganese efflux pump [Clostridia bacterium]
MGFSVISSAILLGLGVSMDAFAVSICKGLAVGKVKIKHMLTAGLWFGGFQALMPLIGFYIGSLFHGYIEKFDHWIAFMLLGAIGINMIKEALSKKEEDSADASFSFRTMLIMAIATSIDALAVGVAIAMESSTNIWLSVSLIGCITFLFSAAGIKIGSIFGEKYKKKAELFGGIVLIFIGLKILFDHLGIL